MADAREQDLVHTPALDANKKEDCKNKNPKAELLIHFEDASCLHDRRFLLALGEALRALAIDVHTGKFLAIMVIHRYLPVAMLSSSIAIELRGLARLVFLHGLWPSK
jgi:hypothetical protein